MVHGTGSRLIKLHGGYIHITSYHLSSLLDTLSATHGCILSSTLNLT
jgi:hypothetical protein